MSEMETGDENVDQRIQVDTVPGGVTAILFCQQVLLTQVISESDMGVEVTGKMMDNLDQDRTLAKVT